MWPWVPAPRLHKQKISSNNTRHGFPQQAWHLKNIGKISNNSGCFSDHFVIMKKHQHFAQRVDCPIIFRLHRVIKCQISCFVSRMTFFKHPADISFTRKEMGIKNQIRHHIFSSCYSNLLNDAADSFCQQQQKIYKSAPG